MWTWARGILGRYHTVAQDIGVRYVPDTEYLQPGWKATISLGAWILGLCLSGNIAVFIWAFLQHDGPDEGAFTNGITVFLGDCGRADTIKVWSHLAINVLSTLILNAGAACMQCLSAPTRKEVDVAHRKGSWFHIGLLSTRNLVGIQRRRAVLYVILAISSVPLHFFYNSVLYSTLGVNDSLALLTTGDFATFAAVNETQIDSLVDARRAIYPQWDYGNNTGYNIWLDLFITPPPYPANDRFRHAVATVKPGDPLASFRNVSWGECLDLFNHTPYKQVQNVALVTSINDFNNSVLDMLLTLTPGQADWTCNAENGTFSSTNAFLGKCSSYLNGTLPAAEGFGVADKESWKVDYCLVHESQGHCSITFDPSLMIAVITVNAIKLAILVYTIYFLDYRPLITAGDAVVSFMEHPDLVTTGVGVHSTQSVSASAKVEYLLSHLPSKMRSQAQNPKKGVKRQRKMGRLIDAHDRLMHMNVWREQRKHWGSAVSKARWIVTILPWTALTLVTIAYALTARPNLNVGTISKISSSEAWSQGLGAVNAGFVIRSLADNSLVQLVVISNLPQFFISCLYILYTALITSMLIAAEMTDFTKEAKGMRVSPPRIGYQRSTYFLQVPYRYSIPMNMSIIVLHWLTSQSLFLVRLAQYDITGQLVNSDLERTLGYSLRGIAAAATCAGLLTLAPVFLSMRRFPKGIPVLGYNSLALSIACHPSPDEPEDSHQQPLKYGIIEISEEHGLGTQRIGFSAGPVKPIEEGTEYEAPRCLSTIFAPNAGADLLCTLDARDDRATTMDIESAKLAPNS